MTDSSKRIARATARRAGALLPVLLAGSALAAPPPDDARPDAPTLLGRVVDASGAPIAGATVRALRADLAADRRDESPEAWIDPLVTATDDDGGFRFELPGATTYTLRAESPAHAPAGVERARAGGSVELRLEAGWTLRGSVVESGTAEPLAGASVLACDAAARRFGREACRRSLTDDEGAFVVGPLPAGAVELRAQARGHAVSDVLVLDGPVPSPAPGPALELRAGARVAGRVVDRRGRGVPAARVYVRRLSVERGSGLDPPRRWPSHSDADGHFELAGVEAGASLGLYAHRADRGVARGGVLELRPGEDVEQLEILLPEPAELVLALVDERQRAVDEFELYFRSSGAGPSGYRGPAERLRGDGKADDRSRFRFAEPGEYDLLLVPRGHRETERRGVVLEAGQTTDVGTVVVTSGLRLSGRVSDRKDEPIAHATVEARRPGEPSAGTRRTLTDESGRFELTGLDPVTLEVEASAPGFVPERMREVAAGTEELEFRLELTGALAGRVELDDGEAPEAFLVVVHREADDEAEAIPAEPPLRRSFSTEDGSYRVEDIAPGRYTVEARAPGRVAARRTGLRVADGRDADVPTLVLREGAVIAGRVVSDADERPVAGAEIEARSVDLSLVSTVERRRQLASSDADGQFRITGLEGGRVQVRASHRDFAPAELRLELEPDRPVDDVVLRLTGGGALLGTVRDPDGEPSIGRRITATRELADQDHLAVALTDGDGAYEFERLAAGSYVVTLLPRPGMPDWRVDVKHAVIREGDLTRLDFDEAPRITLSGTVYRRGVPLGHAELFFTRSLSLTEFEAARSDANGSYEVGLDEPGNYRVLVQAGPSAASGGSSTEIQVPDLEHVFEDIHLGDEGIHGTVTDQDGRPVGGAVVSARADAPAAGTGGFLVAETDAAGRYSIQGLGEGHFRVTASAPGFRLGVAHPVEVRPDRGPTEVDFALEPGGTLAGQLLDETGRGIAGAPVLAAPAGTSDPWGAAAATAITDVNGRFRLTAPGEGPLELTALPGGWAPARLAGVLPGDGDEPLTLRATRGGDLLIRVASADGAAVSGVAVAARPIPPFLGSELAALIAPPTPTDANGSTRLRHLLPGRWEILLPGRDDVAPLALTVAEGTETLVRIELP